MQWAQDVDDGPAAPWKVAGFYETSEPPATSSMNRDSETSGCSTVTGKAWVSVMGSASKGRYHLDESLVRKAVRDAVRLVDRNEPCAICSAVCWPRILWRAALTYLRTKHGQAFERSMNC